MLGNNLTGKGTIVNGDSKETKSKRQGRGKNRAGVGTVRGGHGNKWDF